MLCRSKMAWCTRTAAGSKERERGTPRSDRSSFLTTSRGGLRLSTLSTRPSSCWPAIACSVLVSWLAGAAPVFDPPQRTVAVEEAAGRGFGLARDVSGRLRQPPVDVPSRYHQPAFAGL